MVSFRSLLQWATAKKSWFLTLEAVTLDINNFLLEKKTADGRVSIEVLNTEGIRDFGGQYIDEILMNKVASKAGVHISEIAD